MNDVKQFLQQSSREKIMADITGARLRIIKQVFLALAVIVGGGLVGLQWVSAFKDGVITLGAVIASASFVGLTVFAMPFLKWHVMLVAQSLAIFFILAPFWGMVNGGWLVILWFIAAIVTAFAILSVEARSRAAVSFNIGVLGAGVGILIFVMVFIFTALYYGMVSRDDRAFFVSEKNVTQMLNIGRGAIAGVVPNFHPAMTVEEYVLALSAGEKERLIAILEDDPRYQALHEDQRAQVQAQFLEQFQIEALAGLSGMLGRTIEPGKTFASFLYEYLKSRLVELPENVQRVIFVGWFALVFFAAWSFGMLLRPVILFFVWIFIQAFVAIGLIRVNKETVERKYLALS